MTLIAANGVIPAPYQVRGKLSQARNDKLLNTHVVMYHPQIPQSLPAAGRRILKSLLRRIVNQIEK